MEKVRDRKCGEEGAGKKNSSKLFCPCDKGKKVRRGKNAGDFFSLALSPPHFVHALGEEKEGGEKVRGCLVWFCPPQAVLE